MVQVRRNIKSLINRWLFRSKVILLYGPRQVGKTTLSRDLLKEHATTKAYYNCEINSVKSLLSTKEPTLYRKEFGNYKMVVFDEAQHVPEIGLILKIIIDHLPDLQIVATGSSSFELAEKTSEPLTGRALTFYLFPFSYNELGQLYKPSERNAQLHHYLCYGLYPEIVMSPKEDARFLLDELSSRYLYKDIFMFENIRKSDVVHKLLQLLAFQIGQEVSYHELSNTLKVNQRTVERYIDLLEKAFVIFTLTAFSRNLRKEISKKRKIYFYDVGIRNSIIQQYHSIDMRMDNEKGALWENFIIVERLKFLQSNMLQPKLYFWRTHDQQEIDFIEEMDGRLVGYEFKWQSKKKRKKPQIFLDTYPNSEIHFVDTDNFESFIEGE